MSQQHHIIKLSIIVIFITITLFKPVEAQEQRLTLQQIIDSVKINHPLIKSYELNSKFYKQPFAIPIPPTEVIFRNGYLYGINKELELRIRQEFGSPFQWNIQKSLNQSASLLETHMSTLKQMELIADIKKKYYECLFFQVKHNTLKHIIKTLEFFYESSGWMTNDSNEIEKLKIEQLINKWVVLTDDTYHERLYSENKLVHSAMLFNYTVPADTILELYQIEPVATAETRTPATFYKTLSIDKKNYAQLTYKMKKAALYPSFFAGYQVRNHGNKNYFSSWEFGVRVPMYWKDFKNEIDKASLAIQLAEYDQLLNESEIEKNTANLLVLLNKYFVHLNHLRNYALTGAQKIENLLINKVIDNKIITYSDFEIYLNYQEQIIDYYETINKYNQAAIELELYAY